MSFVEKPIHVYAAEGTFTVTLTVLDATGAFDTVTLDVTVTGGD